MGSVRSWITHPQLHVGLIFCPTEEDGSGLFLVDFQKKVIDGVLEKRDRAREEEEERQRREIEEEKQQLQEPVPEPENEDEEWYVNQEFESLLNKKYT